MHFRILYSFVTSPSHLFSLFNLLPHKVNYMPFSFFIVILEALCSIFQVYCCSQSTLLFAPHNCDNYVSVY